MDEVGLSFSGLIISGNEPTRRPPLLYTKYEYVYILFGRAEEDGVLTYMILSDVRPNPSKS
jgi:hypothetical protein